MIRFTVLGNPLSQNRVYRRAKQGRMFMTSEGKAFKEVVAYCAGARFTQDAIEGPCGVEIVCYFDSRRPDVDGPCKLVLDALQGVIVKNDRQFEDVRMVKKLDRANPRLEVHVWRIEAMAIGGA